MAHTAAVLLSTIEAVPCHHPPRPSPPTVTFPLPHAGRSSGSPTACTTGCEAASASSQLTTRPGLRGGGGIAELHTEGEVTRTGYRLLSPAVSVTLAASLAITAAPLVV